ncbi:hypothetical protein SAMN05216577_111108 [Pseudomonas citronellolis]|uniref:Uncharacterized protein n=1 Tax=Pseudomonas citronellolis TaxID=53408 RepID=A0AAQ1KFL3_9PSED|nr:hypothetical protein SAMN05216577_111108 [Pseudomonas citronellolis]
MKVRDMAQLIVRLPEQDKEWLVRKASEQERSQNWLVARLIREARERDERQDKQAAA